MSQLKLLDYACTRKVFIPTQIKLSTNEVYSAGNDMNVLAGLIVMHDIAA
jgi:hypothetical protein